MTTTLNKTTVESKAVLARMLATENLSVEHDPKAETAYFDVQSRKLVFPCWKGMTDHLYDMLTGHETAHALFTPAGSAALEDAVKKVDPRPEAAFAAKQYLNVVEDARIERLVKEKYPGLRRTFFLAYQDLVKSELMAPAVSRVHELKLIDRANLHYKVGTFVDVPFTETELRLVERMEQTETFEEVVELARLMWEHEKEEKRKQEQEKQKSEEGEKTTAKKGEGKSEEGEGNDSKPSEEQGEESESKSSTETKSEEKKEETPAKNESKSKGTERGESNETAEQQSQEPMPEGSETDGMLNEFSKSKKDKYASYYKTCNLPKFRKEIGVIPASVVIPVLAECGEKNNGLKHYGEWKSRNAESVAVLCREFERRRAADTAARTSMSDSGALDVNRLWSYRVSDEIFAQYANVKTGQSHGLQVFVDFSGSMSGIMYETMCQMISLAAFCRRMNVPFDVYAFTDGLPMGWMYPGVSEKEYYAMKEEQSLEKFAAFKSEPEGMRDDDTRFRLVHLLTTGISERQFRMAVGGMLACVSREVYEGPWNPYARTASGLFRLNGTPTNKATLAAMDLVPEFRKRYNLQIVHAVFLTDGESGDRLCGPVSCEWPNNRGMEIAGYVLRDSVTGNTEKATNSYCATSQNRALNRLLAKRVKGCNVIGISLCPTREFRNKMQEGGAKKDKNGTYDTQIEAAKVKGYCEGEGCYGYTRWFGMNAPHLDSSDYFAGIDSDAPKAVMTKAFAKTLKKATMNRGLLSRFVELIAK